MPTLTLTPVVRALQAERIYTFEASLGPAMGPAGNDTYSFIFAVGTTINIIVTMLFRPMPSISVHYIDDSWIEREKQAAFKTKSASAANAGGGGGVVGGGGGGGGGGDATGFVSTNDILTSWYFISHDCDCGLMAINGRNRIAGCDDTHAGNYEMLLGYQPVDFTSPGLIRRSLAPLRRAVSGPFCGFFGQIFKTRIAVLSTWATFYTDLVIPVSTQTLHLPLVEIGSFPFDTIGILFRPTMNTLGLLDISRSVIRPVKEGEGEQAGIRGSIMPTDAQTGTAKGCGVVHSVVVGGVAVGLGGLLMYGYVGGHVGRLRWWH